MITITASESFRMAKPDDLTEEQSNAWDYYFVENGWSVFIVDFDGCYLVIDETERLEDAFVFQAYDSFLDWLSEIGRGFDAECSA